MTQVELIKLQNTILIIAKEIKRICEKNSIPYTLDGGTLIGAVRHKGFIPWDDDFDISMSRENYRRFLAVCRTDLGKEFSLQTWDNDKNYPNGFCKIILNNTFLMEKETINSSYKRGIYVDVFPWDYVPASTIQEKLHMLKTYYYKKIICLHDGVNEPENTAKYKKMIFSIFRVISKVYTHDGLVKAFSKELEKYKNGSYVACMTGVYGYKKTKLEAIVFSEYTSLKFEDTYFSAVKEYDKMLRHIYGDYMVIPPVEKRRIHNLVSIDFGPYK